MASAIATANHDKIRQWAEEHGVRPATLRSTESEDGEPGIVQLDCFKSHEGLDSIPWDAWFERFELRGLALPYAPKSRFDKLVRRKPS
jgi:hypothetical protein